MDAEVSTSFVYYFVLCTQRTSWLTLTLDQYLMNFTEEGLEMVVSGGNYNARYSGRW